MRPQHVSQFELKPGTWVFAPSKESRDFGAKLVERILRRWRPPDYLYNLRRGGHVAAARLHQSAPHIIRLDIDRFFDRVSRTKVSRALRAIGFSADEAFGAAALSTVVKPEHGGFSIPFGFVQSPLLASLVLDRSCLGRALRRTRRLASLSVYVDDILVSCDDAAGLSNLASELRIAADTSNLPLNLGKSQFEPQPSAEAFNLHIGLGSVRVNGARLSRFRADAFGASAEQLNGYVWYLHSVNPDQALAFLDDLEQAGLSI